MGKGRAAHVGQGVFFATRQGNPRAGQRLKSEQEAKILGKHIFPKTIPSFFPYFFRTAPFRDLFSQDREKT